MNHLLYIYRPVKRTQKYSEKVVCPNPDWGQYNKTILIADRQGE